MSHSQRYLALLIALGWVFLAACESGSNFSSAPSPAPPGSVGVSSGAALLSVSVNGLAAQTDYGRLLVALPATGQQITLIKADVTLPSGYARTGDTIAGAYLYMAFGTGSDKLYAGIGFQDDGAASAGAVAGLVEMSASQIQAYPVNARSGHWANGSPLPITAGATCTFGIAVDTATQVFTFSLTNPGGGGCNGGVDISTAVDASAWPAPLFAPVTLNNAMATWFVAQVSGQNAGGGNGAITASFDNVMVGYGGGAATLFDDFVTGTLDPAKWAIH